MKESEGCLVAIADIQELGFPTEVNDLELPFPPFALVLTDKLLLLFYFLSYIPILFLFLTHFFFQYLK
jgi:hypothetical protein